MARYSEGDCCFCSFFNASGHEKTWKSGEGIFRENKKRLIIECPPWAIPATEIRVY